MKACDFHTDDTGLLRTFYILIADFNRYVTHFTHFPIKVYKNNKNNKHPYMGLTSSTKRVSDWRGCGAKACKVCDASIELCKNPVTTMPKAGFLHTFYILIADFNRYVTHFTHFPIKGQITNIIFPSLEQLGCLP